MNIVMSGCKTGFVHNYSGKMIKNNGLFISWAVFVIENVISSKSPLDLRSDLYLTFDLAQVSFGLHSIYVGLIVFKGNVKA